MILELVSINDVKKANDHLIKVIYQPLTDALYEMTKTKPDDPIEWLADFMLRNNNNKPLIHDTNSQAVQKVMELKEEEKREKNRKRLNDDVPAKCGCYLSKSSSTFSSISENL